MFWVRPVYFNVRYILPKSGTFLPGHSVYVLRMVKIENSAGREFANKCHCYSRANLCENREDVFILKRDVQKRPAFSL